MKDILEKYSLAHLKKIVRRSNIVGYTKFNKDNLIKEMLKPQHKGNFKYLKKLKHDSVDDRKNNMKLVDGDLKVRREENKAKREANKKKKEADLKLKVPALTERKTAKKAVKTTKFGPVKPVRGVMKKKAIPTITITESKSKGKTQKDYNVKTDKLKKVDKKLKLPKKKEEPKKKVEIKKRIVKKKEDSSMSNFKKSQEGKEDIDKINDFYKNIRMGKSSMYNKVSDIKSIIKILKSNNQKVKDNFSDTRREILLESAEEILEGLSSSKDKPKKEESEEEDYDFGELKDISDKVKKTRNIKPKKPVKKEPKKKPYKPIVYETPMMKKARIKKEKEERAKLYDVDRYDFGSSKKKEDKPKKKQEKSSDSTNKKELHAKYLKKFNNLKDKNIKASRSQFEPKKEIDREEIEEKIEKINKVIISLEEDIKKTDSTRLKDLLPYFINMKKTYNLDLKN